VPEAELAQGLELARWQGKTARRHNASAPTLRKFAAVISSLGRRASIKMTEDRRAFVTIYYFLLALPLLFAKLPPASNPNSTRHSNLLAHEFFSD
jgi:hypothetical protein